MRPDTVLVPTGCDLKRLPLDASEVFLLSRLDGQSTLEEISEISGLAFDKARRLAERLVILGAVKPVAGPESASKRRPEARIDPRAESASIRPPRLDARAESASVRPARLDARAEAVESPKPRTVRPPKAPTVRPPKMASRPAVRAASMRPPKSATPTPEQKKRRSTRSIKAQRPGETKPAETEVCELDADTQNKIRNMEAKVALSTYYELFDVERDADKKDIKRAYFALASTYHPDRFFGKKLGPLRTVIERVFVRLTEANDVLGSRQRREAYDATLPPMPKVEAPKVEAPKAEPPPEPKPEKKPSRRMSAARLSPTPQKMSKRMRRSQMMAAAGAIPPPPASDPLAEREKFQRLQAAAKMLAGQTRAAAMVKAAEDCVRSGDIMGAANNYRLALQMHDDPVIKDKLAVIDRHSRDLRFEKYIARGRAGERAERWEDAAADYIRANDARKDANAAERAANALRLARGDLRQATSLAEQAVADNGKNAEYRITLGEVLYSAKLLVRAKEECDEALSLSPQNPRAKALAAALKKA